MYLQVCPADKTINDGPWKIGNCEVFYRLVEDSAGLMYSLR